MRAKGMGDRPDKSQLVINLKAAKALGPTCSHTPTKSLSKARCDVPSIDVAAAAQGRSWHKEEGFGAAAIASALRRGSCPRLLKRAAVFEVGGDRPFDSSGKPKFSAQDFTPTVFTARPVA